VLWRPPPRVIGGTVEVGPDLECWFNAAGREELLEKEYMLVLIK
jgi:hypothetical protein